MRRLVQIDPLFNPTRSVLALYSAIEFAHHQAVEKKVSLSQELTEKLAHARTINSATIIESPSLTLETLRDVLADFNSEMPKTNELALVRVPESVDSMRFVTSVETLANTLLALIRGLNLLP